MSRQEGTEAFIRLLIATTIDKRIIDDDTLMRIETSAAPFNPIDYTVNDHSSSEDRFALGEGFSEVLAQGVDWKHVQQVATKLRNDLAIHLRDSLEASEKTRWLPTTAPIIVDAVRTGGLVRLNYLCIECDTPKTGWGLDIAGQSFPFLLLGLSGVILHPFDSLIFDTPNRIERLFETVEEKLGFDIAIGDFWFPDSMLGENLAAGSVFRVDLTLFQRAYTMRETSWKTRNHEEKSSWSAAFDQLGNLPLPEFSRLETEAFSQWSEQQIADVSERNPKNAESDEGQL
jgi:hypothetical protein